MKPFHLALPFCTVLGSLNLYGRACVLAERPRVETTPQEQEYRLHSERSTKALHCAIGGAHDPRPLRVSVSACVRLNEALERQGRDNHIRSPGPQFLEPMPRVAVHHGRTGFRLNSDGRDRCRAADRSLSPLAWKDRPKEPNVHIEAY
ncbi:hypothetical protein C8Q70DRAFT_350789 [Cubamyces menziesii]|nr:hypothetical protein C8Q70DRAFT_350789 [Cubamyces menziesii]